MKTTFRLFLLIALLTSIPTIAESLNAAKIPEPLKPWSEWVLHAHTDIDCPFAYNTNQRQCAWPSGLALNLTTQGGDFTQTWVTYAETWAVLPGDEKHWPQDVTIDGTPALVTARGGLPAVRLAPGQYRLQGVFAWERLPQSLAINPHSGLIGLTVNRLPVIAPKIDKQGRIWLQDHKQDKTSSQSKAVELEFQVFRRIIDDNPMQVLTRVLLDVAGNPRQIVLEHALLAGFKPLRLKSPLPARLEADGGLRLQVRPGHWTIEVSGRQHGDSTQLSMARATPPWPENEIWVFDARNHLRLVEIEDAVAVDSRHTNLPDQWRHLPAYRIQQGEALKLKVVRRGDPEPEPNRLALERTLWLDFDGKAYTIQDHITGSMTSGWRLETLPQIALGRVSINDEAQLITSIPGSDRPGVEVRRGSIDLSADSRYDWNRTTLPATGWDHDFNQVRTLLNLPPGWKLFAVAGTDNVPNTWLQRWTLLDLFLVLIAAVAAARLWGWHWGLLTLVTLALIWHEPYAPRYVWLNILAATALLRVLPPGWLQRTALWYRALSFIALLLIAIPFLVQEVRSGFFPQLERPWQAIDAREPKMSPAVVTGQLRSVIPEAAMEMRSDQIMEKRGRKLTSQKPGSYSAPAPEPLQRIDPKAHIQTGPGLPRWQWNRVELTWNGPVDRNQNIQLYLISPTLNLALNLLRILLLIVLALRLFDRGITHGILGRKAVSVATALICLPLLELMPRPVLADFPPQKMLEELENRLLEPPECQPQCALIPRMRVLISPERLQTRLELHALSHTAVPLPLNTRQWTPEQVTVNDKQAAGLMRKAGGQLWLDLEQGRHQISLSGKAPALSRFQLPLPLTPRYVEVQASGWVVEGVHADGIADRQIQFSRQIEGKPRVQTRLEPSTLPPFVSVERTLRLGLDWRVENRVTRLSPPGTPIVIQIPLLQGESVITDGLEVIDHKVLISMGSKQSSLTWLSNLKKAQELLLTAFDNDQAVEVWRADIGPLWHVSLSGIPAVHHQNRNANWLPEFRPWPGEQVSLKILRPKGVPGKILTIDHSLLSITPGNRATDASLVFSLRSSQGGQHSISLPPYAELTSVNIDNVAQPIRLDGQTVTLPVSPGTQRVRIQWREPEGISNLLTTPTVDLGAGSVNASTTINMSRDRWLLFTGGPKLGPAVLFWGVLLVIVLLAIVLGRIQLTPLKTWHWLLLGIGLSQSPVWVGLSIVGWLIALGMRAKLHADTSNNLFNLVQIGLGLLTLGALLLLFSSVKQGLLGSPEMQIAGNRSHVTALNWYQDRADTRLPTAWAYSVPLWIYRVLMLGWALWLAFSLLAWLRWGWQCFSRHGLWRSVKIQLPRRRQPAAKKSE